MGIIAMSKVSYIPLWDKNMTSTAYVPDDTTEDTMEGTNKYTDEPVKLVWSEELQAWLEIERE